MKINEMSRLTMGRALTGKCICLTSAINKNENRLGVEV